MMVSRYLYQNSAVGGIITETKYHKYNCWIAFDCKQKKNKGKYKSKQLLPKKGKNDRQLGFARGHPPYY
jgi:hypothetical protein